MQWEGFGGLYKGVMSPLVGQMFFRSTLFGAFAASKSFIKVCSKTGPSRGNSEVTVQLFSFNFRGFPFL